MAQAFDYIVIGAGSAGCAVAYRLVNNTDARVLLIEAGGRDTLPEIHSEILTDTFSLWGRPEIDWGYVTEEQPSLNDRTIPVARGKVWGGCSTVNAML
ncbi:MAG: GMC family oxidoreductase N-terminal domain-containing protein, partial [Caldilineaceae bacterium]|nr:GMC family oxidoreductase N-terminal domain-containing protein [Caldilineaceae bacterium]